MGETGRTRGGGGWGGGGEDFSMSYLHACALPRFGTLFSSAPFSVCSLVNKGRVLRR